MTKADYLKRIYKAYLTKEKSQLTFWHDKAEFNEKMRVGVLGQYYMKFHQKADYTAHLDSNGVPLLNYHGVVGVQYNPIAIAQYGLGNYNLWCDTGERQRYENLISAANWLVRNLVENRKGVRVWMHDFDFEYFRTLKAPWYSGLAQGQGISLLLRAAQATNDPVYARAAEKAYESITLQLEQGGVTDIDEEGHYWIEEYVLQPTLETTKILNGFLWGLWGAYDFWLTTKREDVHVLFQRFVGTIKANLHRYDTGYWSYYELTPQAIMNIASPFYHGLHVTQLRVMYAMTGDRFFEAYAEKWSRYKNSFLGKNAALFYKVLFKLLYY